MDFFSLLWLFLILSSLQPALRKRFLDAQRYSTLRLLQRSRHSRVILLIHRQETVSFLGIPLARYIDINDSEDLLRVIKQTSPTTPIDLVLHTPGGLVLAAEQIARALHSHEGKVTVFVPHYAMSGGTLIAMAADEIVMDSHAVLGPVDPQIGDLPAASILRVVEQKDVNSIDDRTLVLADVGRKALVQVSDTVYELLAERLPPEQAKATVQALASGQFTHDYPITVAHARELGLVVSTDMPDAVYGLMALYPQTSQRRPSVEYVPEPVSPRTPRSRRRTEP
jgi:ClpP class serine protease